MATKKKAKTVKLSSYAYIHRFAAGVALFTFFVVILSSLRVDAPLDHIVNSIVFRSAIAICAVIFVKMIVIRILKTYEEMNSGQS